MVDTTWLSKVGASLSKAEGMLQSVPDSEGVEVVLFPHIREGYLCLQDLGIMEPLEIQEVFDYLDRVSGYDFTSLPFLSKILRDLSYHVEGGSRETLRGYASRVDRIEETLD